jgi:hypothetical protein
MPNTREKLIELLTQVAVLGDYLDMRKVADHLIANGVTIATDIIVGDKVSPNDKDINVPISWISVTERLPEKGGSYLVFSSKSKTVFTAHYWLGDRWANRANGQFITHWMPLPKPPEGE